MANSEKSWRLEYFQSMAGLERCYGVIHNVTSHKDTTHNDASHKDTSHNATVLINDTRTRSIQTVAIDREIRTCNFQSSKL